MSRLVLVAGLTHSGSTVLDLLLGSHPRLVGMGEVMPLLRPGNPMLDEPDRVCSCGEPLESCPFWSAAQAELRRQPGAMVPQRYRRLLDVFAEVFGRDFIPVDSPKSLDALRTAVSVPELGVQVLHLIRDVRSWTISRLDTDTRQGDFTPRDLYRKHGSDAWRPLVLRNSYARFLVWHRGNHRIQKFMAERNLPVLRVGYEEFAAGSLTGMTVASLPRP